MMSNTCSQKAFNHLATPVFSEMTRSMTTANNLENNLSPWQPGQSGNPSGRPKGTRDLAGYVPETTDGDKELVDDLVCD